ncbi:bromodomain-containing protein 7-like isoform X2 [Periplaneta americana]|uniref:bromodomain-containing protein 7-like isoform X2 n=1 Tax=Periplaneta americana TaxID=6978 RepID=UPI0037E9B43E
MGSKKHKKHKSDKRDRYEGDEESRQSAASFHGREDSHLERQHKKAKKKKKKKEKDKDRDKHEKKHKHHHKEKRKRPRDESSQDDISMGEESLSDPPLPKRVVGDGSNCNMKPNIVGEGIQNHGMSADGIHQHHPGQVPVGMIGISREPRSCVLRQRQERSPLQKLLDYLLKGLEKRDPQQFFAWPVTDHIAPGYSQIIHQPMDFSTMKQKIDENQYSTLNEYIEDFKLMCNNAMVYNHPETIYYKAAKKLLHVGLKMMSPDKLKPLLSVLTYMAELSREELGFDLGFEELSQVSGGIKTESSEDAAIGEEGEEAAELRREHRRKLRDANRPLGKFEAIPDDLTPEEILEQAQRAAQAAAERLTLKRPNTNLGFLRQRKDGSTSLSILVPGDGVTPGTNERPISLGMLTGKLTHGTGQLQGFREDRRNVAKTVKPLYYGAFGSYAPSYDSTFANLTKEESDLVYQTYGDETCVQYAESILDFSKDCDYTLTMVDNLLDLLTGGEHRKTKRILEERRRLREEEERIRQLLEGKPVAMQGVHDDKMHQMPNFQQDIKVDFGALKSLSELGIDTKFLDIVEQDIQVKDEQRAAEEAMQVRLDQTSALLQKLQQVQSDRLSLTPPAHLSHVAQPSDSEVQLAEKITESLKDMAKKVDPVIIAPVQSLRKAMGILPAASPSSPAEVVDAETSPGDVNHDDGEQRQNSGTNTTDGVTSTCENGPGNTSNTEVSGILNESTPSEPMVEEVDVEGTSSQAEAEEEPEVPDLESELREFLESEPALSNSPLQDDRTIEEILSES